MKQKTKTCGRCGRDVIMWAREDATPLEIGINYYGKPIALYIVPDTSMNYPVKGLSQENGEQVVGRPSYKTRKGAVPCYRSHKQDCTWFGKQKNRGKKK